MSTSLTSVLAPKRNRLGREPVVAEGFLDHHEIGERLLGCADAAGGFHADADAGREKIIADGFEHHERDGHRRGGD